MATTVIEPSRRRRHACGSEGLDRRLSAEPAEPALDARRRLSRIVDAAAAVPDVEFLSASLNPSDGSIRIELLSPLLSVLERRTLETELRSAAPDYAGSGPIAFVFVDSAFG